MLKSKLHRATVTDANLDYEGSCSISLAMCMAAGIINYEQIQIYNVTNGERFTTYAIRDPETLDQVCMNGSAAHKANIGDKVIICTYGHYNDQESRLHVPTEILLDDNNRMK